MVDASTTTTSGLANAGLLQKVGAGANVGTLGTLLLVGALAREAFEAQLDATEDAVEAIEDVRDSVEDTQRELASVKSTLDEVESSGNRERDELERKLRSELDALRLGLAELDECVREKRCKR